ncbi:AlwI family type II restriction endonuclease [Paraeggerthella sp. Marseille-Q4926]|uniref:AlwI family type II restriction endonuclease n=1 Tax=Paraeggerthella sp. Marseille-Q4926 TaxID=2866587 RepID=UPI001CE44C1A|nr:AlwI family type II restriction endonuclease [Paraeggerthella sp. Marseille-Q4926]
MEENQIDIWLVGNTGLRNPARIADGFKLYAQSPFVGQLVDGKNDIAFTSYLSEHGVINNKPGKDTSGSHARKWRLMFERNGLIYPKIRPSEGRQEDLGQIGQITPFGYSFLQADTYPAQQECFLRAMSVEQIQTTTEDSKLFSPLRWILAIMLELENRTGSSELTRTEFALWGHTTDPTYDLTYVVDNILDLRKRRKAAPSKHVFDRNEISERGKVYPKKKSNFFDYTDMNMRYLRITGVLQRKGRGLVIVPTKHVIAQKLAKTTASNETLFEARTVLSNGAPLPSDDFATAKELLSSIEKMAKEQSVYFDISDLELDNTVTVNIARHRVEEALQLTNEQAYADRQRYEWEEIAEYMRLIEQGGGVSNEEDEESRIDVPKDELPAYLEWVLWRSELAIDSMITEPNEVRGFKIDSDFLPVSTAGGGRGDLYCEYQDFMLVTEVSMSTSSRQEAMEGEPVRRHVSDAIDNSSCPVYGLFIATRIDTNTAETFRHGVWYSKQDNKRRLDIVPLTLQQFRQYFVAMFESNKPSPERLRELILECTIRRDALNGPEWKDFIERTVQNRTRLISEGNVEVASSNLPIMPGMTVEHPVFGMGQIILAKVIYRDKGNSLGTIPFINQLPDGIRMLPDGKSLEHEGKGLLEVLTYQVAFGDTLIPMKREDLLTTTRLYY